MATSTRRLLCASFLSSILIILLCMLYTIGNSAEPLDDVTYYAAHVDQVMGHVWRKIEAAYYLPHNKHVTDDTPTEILSCMSSHKQDDTFIEEQMKLQQNRREALSDACRKYYAPYNTGQHKPATSLLIEDYHLLYAQTAKIAGTSWDRVFLVLSHLANGTSRFSQSKSIDETRIHVPRLTNYRRQDRSYIWKNFTTFMFSRHPFSRLLSAYNCKVGPRATQEHIARGYYDHLREGILKRYPSTGQRGIPDFRSFVQYILDNDYFQDPHWKENYKIVAPCDMDYDIIGHFETLEEDARFILQSVGADCFVQFPSTEGSAATNSSHEDTLKQSFETLSRELIERLYQKYRLDFLLFGYTFEITVEGQYLQFPPKGIPNIK